MEQKKIIRSAGTIGFFILFSRMLGLVRDMAMAAFFGSSKAMDAFVVAFTIPNLFRSLFGEGALSSAFVPVFTEALARENRAKVWSFANNMFSFLSMILAAIVAILIMVASLVRGYCPASDRIVMILDFTRIMLPYMFFICLTAFFSSILNSLRRFFMPAATYAALNIVMIAALFLVCPHLDPSGNARILAVAWSVILAGIVQCVMQLPLLWHCGFRLRLNIDWHDPRVRRVWQLMGAAAIGVGVTQINVLIDRLIATIIGEGAPSYLYYAERLVYFPLGIFGTALGTVLLPAFSAHVAQNRADMVNQTLNQSFRQLLFMTVPAAIGMLILAKPIIQVIYEHGDFSSLSTRMTAWALIFYSPGLIVFSLLKILIPVFYAQQDMITPVRVGIGCTCFSVALKLILMWPLKHAGIALGTVIAISAEVVIFIFLINRRFGSPGWRTIIHSFAKILAAAAVMGLVAFLSHHACQQYLFSCTLPTRVIRILSLFTAIGFSVFAYLAAAFILKTRELSEFKDALLHKAKA